jgi:hypothetical protein
MSPQVAPALLLGIVTLSAVAHAQSVESPPGESFTLSERWSHYLRRTYGPARSGYLAAEIAFDQMLGEPACWDKSAGSYAQRYGRAFDRRLIRNTVEFTAGFLTGEDLRYRSSRSGSIPRRIWDAAQSALTARMPDGRKRPAYTRFLASAVVETSTTHWTGQRIQPGWAFQAVGWSALDQIETNLLDEFSPDIRRFAKHLWQARRRK